MSVLVVTGRKVIWHLLGTISGREHVADASLRDQGHETYFPADQDGPLFPGYLFVKIEDHQNTESIRRSPYCWMIHFGDTPALVLNALIDEMKERDWHRSDVLAVGSKVRTNALAGVYHGIEAIVHAKQEHRIVLLVNLMNRTQTISLPIKAVEAA